MCTIKKDDNHIGCDDDFLLEANCETKKIINRYLLKKYGLQMNEQEYYEIIDELKKLNVVLKDIQTAIGDIPRQVLKAFFEINHSNQMLDKRQSVLDQTGTSPSASSQISESDIEILDFIHNGEFDHLNIDHQKQSQQELLMKAAELIQCNINEYLSPLSKGIKFSDTNIYQNNFYMHWQENFQKNQSIHHKQNISNAWANNNSKCWLYSDNYSNDNGQSNAQELRAKTSKVSIMPYEKEIDLNVWLMK